MCVSGVWANVRDYSLLLFFPTMWRDIEPHVSHVNAPT